MICRYQLVTNPEYTINNNNLVEISRCYLDPISSLFIGPLAMAGTFLLEEFSVVDLFLWGCIPRPFLFA